MLDRIYNGTICGTHSDLALPNAPQVSHTVHHLTFGEALVVHVIWRLALWRFVPGASWLEISPAFRVLSKLSNRNLDICLDGFSQESTRRAVSNTRYRRHVNPLDGRTFTVDACLTWESWSPFRNPQSIQTFEV